MIASGGRAVMIASGESLVWWSRMGPHVTKGYACDNKCSSDNDDETGNHDETKAITCDDRDDDESDKSLAIKRCYNGVDESDKSLAIKR